MEKHILEILDISLTNRYTIFRVSDPVITHKDFTIEILEHFASTYNNNGSKRGRNKGTIIGNFKINFLFIKLIQINIYFVINII